MLQMSRRCLTSLAGLIALLGVATTASAQTSNTIDGFQAMFHNTTGSQNCAFGEDTLFQNTTGNDNTAVGFSALGAQTTAQANVGIGPFAGADISTGNSNVAVGGSALSRLRSGATNVGIGLNAGTNYVTSESNNVVISNPGVTSDSGVIRIGGTLQTSAYISGINGSTSSSGLAVFVNSTGKLGTTTSSKRFKDDIRPMAEASDGLMQLKPVTFYYKPGVDDGSHVLQYGLVAEDVAKVYPGLVQYDDAGQPLAVRYQFVNAMLLNEVQEQHRQLATQQQKIEQLEQKLDELLQHAQR